MAQNAEVQPSFEDIFNILSQVPAEKLLSLKHKLKHLMSGPSSKLLQAMVLLTLGQEADARICLNALGDNLAALYIIHQTKLGTAGVQTDSGNSQHPQLDAGAMALLAQIYLLLANEKLCSHEAVVKAEQAANNASRDAQRDALNSIAVGEQERCSSAISTMDSNSEFRTLRSDVSTGFLRMTRPNTMVKSFPMKIRNTSDPSGPQTLQSSGISDSFTSLLISQSPTAIFRMPTSSCESSQLCEESTSDAGQPDGERQSHSLQETGRASSSSSHSRQDTNPQVPHLGKALQVSSCRPSLPVLETQLPTLGAVGQPVESNDISSTVIVEPQVPKESREEKQKLSTDLPYSRTTTNIGPACIPIEDSYIPAGISNSAPASTSVCSFPPQTYFSSTIPRPLQGVPYNIPCPPHLHSSPPPTGPPLLKTVEAALAPEPNGEKKKFFTFVVLHAWEDEHIACRIKDLLEKMGVPNGATFCEDFLVAGHNQLTCFQDAMENSAFLILLLTKNFLCHQCMFQTNSALMESIQRPSKHNSVIPFVPKENPLERSQIPSMLSVLVALDENSPVFARTVQNTFTPEKINERKAMWCQIQQVQEQKRKLELYRDHCQTLQNLGALTLGSLPQMSPSAVQLNQSSLEQLLEQLLPPQSSQQCHPPMCVSAATHPPPRAGHPTSAQLHPSPFQPLNLPSGQHYTTADPGGARSIIIQHARMVQIGNHNTMHVETAAPGSQDSEEESRENA